MPSTGAPPAGDVTFRIWRKLRSRELQNYRDVYVALPPGYHETEGLYPLVVMHDGQNLFDPATSYAGSWDMAAAIRDLSTRGLDVIVAGVANAGPFRKYEYSPFRDPVHGGGDGDRYLDFLLGTMLPRVRQAFRADPAPGQTLIAGSSMGGLVSLYALWRHPGVFGGAAALSPSAWFADEALRRYLTRMAPPPGRLWLDIGTAEGERTLETVRALHQAIVETGFPPERLRYLEDEGATHQEAHWGRRIGEALGFVLGGEAEGRKGGTPPVPTPPDRA